MTVELVFTAVAAWSKVVEVVTGSAGADGSTVAGGAGGAAAAFDATRSCDFACNLVSSF